MPDDAAPADVEVVNRRNEAQALEDLAAHALDAGSRQLWLSLTHATAALQHSVDHRLGNHHRAAAFVNALLDALEGIEAAYAHTTAGHLAAEAAAEPPPAAGAAP